MVRFVEAGIYIISFVVCFYCLSGVDFAKFLRKGHSNKAQCMLFLFAVALAYLVAQYFIALANL